MKILKSWFIPSLLSFLFVVGGLLGIQAHTDPTEMDTVAYLSAAAEIQETGGILKHIPNCLQGVYREATQHPLYLLILSPFAEHNIRYFIHAKIITLFIAMVLFGVVFAVVRRCFGYKIACICGLLIALNATVIRLSTMVACETLLALCFITFLYFLSRGAEDQRYWVAAGFFAGLTFLTKSLGILTLPIFICTTIWYQRSKILVLLKSKYFWAFFGIFVLTTSPLLLRNMKVYGSPLYSDSSAVLWVDDWHEYSIERAQTGQIGFTVYLKNHSAQDITRIFWMGIVDRDVRMMIDGLKPHVFWKKINLQSLQGFHQRSWEHQEVWALLLTVLFFIGLWKQRRNSFTPPVIFSLFGFFAFTGWFSKIFETTPPTRLLYCILFPVLIYVAVGLSEVLIQMMRIKPISKLAVVEKHIFCLGLFLIITCSFTNHSWGGVNYYKTYKLSPIFVSQLSWVVKNLNSEDKLWVGQSFSSYSFYFKNKNMAQISDIPKVNTLEEYRKRAMDEGVGYAIIDLATVVYNFSVFGKYFSVHPQLGLHQIKDLPDFMKLQASDPRLARFYQTVKFSS